jgi:Polysaccharide lyase family 4, domain III
MGWVAPLIAILLGVGLCALGLWQGRNILGMFGGNVTPTPAATFTPQVVVVPPFVTPSATPKVAAVTASPAAPSPQPPTDTPQPQPPTNTPAPPPPTDTPAPPPPTDTPVPPPPTDTPAPPTEAPTEAPPTEAAPTDTPEGPADQPTAEPTVAVNLPNRIDIEDTDFKGGYTRNDGKYHKTTAHWVYGRGTAYWTMSAPFTVTNPPEGEAYLTIAGLDSEDTAKTPIAILINGQQIYNGPDPLPNDFTTGPNAPGNWGSYTWTIPAGMVHDGVNILTIANLSNSARINSPPFFMLDYATVSWP